jgi:hypothetical protein
LGLLHRSGVFPIASRLVSSGMKEIQIEKTPRLEKLPAQIAKTNVYECDEWKLRFEMPLYPV